MNLIRTLMYTSVSDSFISFGQFGSFRSFVRFIHSTHFAFSTVNEVKRREQMRKVSERVEENERTEPPSVTLLFHLLFPSLPSFLRSFLFSLFLWLVLYVHHHMSLRERNSERMNGVKEWTGRTLMCKMGGNVGRTDTRPNSKVTLGAVFHCIHHLIVPYTSHISLSHSLILVLVPVDSSVCFMWFTHLIRSQHSTTHFHLWI